MASRIQFVPASKTYTPPSGMVIEKIIAVPLAGTASATITLYGDHLFDYVNGNPVKDTDGAGVAFTFVSLPPIDGPFTKVVTDSNASCLAYLK